jgi:catechol 2,3-dioxygenase-like lactoylglutathione lyase family enzyme
MRPPLLGLRHVALSVRDVRRSVEFYRDVLGMQVEWEPDPDNVYLTSGSDNLAIHKLPDGAEPGAVQSVHHIGFIVARLEDVDALAERVEGRGIELVYPLKTHRDGARSFYFRDPDGLLIQVLYHPPISGSTYT